MICEYTIIMIGEYDIFVLSPQMIARLIENIRTSDSKVLVISAQEILPQGYAQYLARVMEANLDIQQENEKQGFPNPLKRTCEILHRFYTNHLLDFT